MQHMHRAARCGALRCQQVSSDRGCDAQSSAARIGLQLRTDSRAYPLRFDHLTTPTHLSQAKHLVLVGRQLASNKRTPRDRHVVDTTPAIIM